MIPGCPERSEKPIRLVVIVLTAAALTAALPAQAATRIPARCVPRVTVARSVVRLCAIHFHYHRTNYWRHRAHLRPLPYLGRAERYPSRAPRILTYWMATQDRARIRATAFRRHNPWTSSWLADAICIHRHEGSWTDPGAPYYGGLQMDASFMRAYGPEFYARFGTADRWPVSDQLLAAYRAWSSRGWSPWPTTRVMCGL